MKQLSKIYQTIRGNKPFAILIIITVASLGLCGFYAVQYYSAKDTDIASQSKASRQLVAQVAKHMELPDETPSIAVVTDKSKLANEAFFAKAQNGDKILIYTKAKQAIIYRPSADRVIAVGPVSLGDDSGGTSSNSD